MDKYDPFEWTADFVASEPQFCKQQLITVCEVCTRYLQKKNYLIAGYALNGILNGLELLQNNMGIDLRYYITHFAVITGIVCLFSGSQTTEWAEELCELAIACLKKALENWGDFLSADYAETLVDIISGIRSDIPLDAVIESVGENALLTLVERQQSLTAEMQKDII